MRKLIALAGLASLSLSFVPVALAADVTEGQVLDSIDTSSDAAMPVPDGKGGGMDSMSIMPYPYGGGVSVDAMVTKEVTPDFVALNGWCTVNDSTRTALKTQLDRLFADIKNMVGGNGRVRKTGGYSVYPVYDQMGKPQTDEFSGTLNVFIKFSNTQVSQQVADYLDEKGCTSNWDVRLNDTQTYELGVLDELITKLNKRKTVFEKLLKKSLTRVTGASLSTWIDGYSTYDPETNKAEAQTTLSVTFDVGGRATINTTPVPMPMEKTMPTTAPRG